MNPLVIHISKAIQDGASFDEVSKICIYAALVLSGGNKAKAAKAVRLDRKTIRRKIEEYDLVEFFEPDEFEDQADATH